MLKNFIEKSFHFGMELNEASLHSRKALVDSFSSLVLSLMNFGELLTRVSSYLVIRLKLTKNTQFRVIRIRKRPNDPPLKSCQGYRRNKPMYRGWVNGPCWSTFIWLLGSRLGGLTYGPGPRTVVLPTICRSQRRSTLGKFS